MQIGRSLDELGHSLSWRDLLVLTRRWRETPGTALVDSIGGAQHWPRAEQLLAEIIDLLQNANWQRAQRPSAPKPKPYPRPWRKTKAKKLGAEPIPMSKFASWWDSKKSRKRPEQ